jgi:hypothetical protein
MRRSSLAAPCHSAPRRRQIEQLQSNTTASAACNSKRTLPQWQAPWWLVLFMAGLSWMSRLALHPAPARVPSVDFAMFAAKSDNHPKLAA